MNRGAAVAAVSLAVLLVATMATPALAAVAPPGDTSPQTNASEVSSAGPFEIDQLRNGGTQPSAAPPSVRYVGDTEIDGAIAVRYRPADPLSNDPVYLEGGQTLNTDQIELYSTVFGDSTGKYELVIVYWQPETRQTENGTPVDVAANQEVQRATVTVEDGYASAPVELNSHYEQNVQATMWLEQDGQAVDGARWRFEHASAPASQQVTIETQADAWWYSFRTAILPGIASIVIGLSAARATLRRTGSGPRYSLTAWGIFSAGGVLAVLGLFDGLATARAVVVGCVLAALDGRSEDLLALDLESFLFHIGRRVVLAAHQFSQQLARNGIAHHGIDDVVKAALGAYIGGHRLEVEQRIDNAPARCGVDPDKPFVLGGDLVRVAVPLEYTPFKAPYILDDRGFEMQAGILDLTDGSAELGNDRLLALGNHINRVDQHQQGDCCDDYKNRFFHCPAPPRSLRSGSSGSKPPPWSSIT